MARTPLRLLIEKGIEAGADYIPDVIETPLRKAFSIDVPKSKVSKPKASLAVTPKAKPKQLALPAPPKVLALPAPGPGLPSFAVKPRGGQFYPDAPLRAIDAQAVGYKLDNYTDDQGLDRYQVLKPDGTPLDGRVASTPKDAWMFADANFRARNPANNKSPEAAARMARKNYGLDTVSGDPTLGNWLERTLAKYYKTDFGSPNDPLRELAERGLHYDAEMTPERWQQSVSDSLTQNDVGYLTLPRSDDVIRAELAGGDKDWSALSANNPVAAGALMQAAPWLRKLPVTDKVYGIQDTLDLGHFVDEMNNAIQPEGSGLPFDLAVRPESLDRMTFAQAAEHVGKINQFRAKEMERAALDAQNNPVTNVFKDYADDNPTGLKWVEMAPPKGDGPTNYDVEEELRKALKYEGDTMGHCVGGYCPDVMQGRSRIFSLRDAKGEPHVTIETRPGGERKALSEIPRDALDEITADAMDETNAVTGPMGISMDDPRWTRTYQTNLGLKQREWVASNPLPDEIVQIKGKQNRAPKDDYLPFVQDFVKSQNWANIGDMQNTGLVRLPDGRYITGQQAEEIISAIPETTEMVRGFASSEMVPMRRVYDPTGLDRLDPEEWRAISQHFEGYAVGGRVRADRCFSKGKSAVYAVNKSRK